MVNEQVGSQVTPNHDYTSKDGVSKERIDYEINEKPFSNCSN